LDTEQTSPATLPENGQIMVSAVVVLSMGSHVICEYHGCSGDCDCDGDTGCPNPEG